MSRIIIALLLTACNATTAEVEDIGDDDGDTTANPVIGDDDDDDDTTTPYEPAESTWFLSGTLDVPANAEIPAGDVIVALIAMTGDIEFQDDLLRQVNIGPISAGGSVDYQIGLPDEVADQWYWIDDDEPDMEVAVFSLGAYIDVDGDGEATTADTYVAAHQFPFIASIRGALGNDVGYLGGAVGWNYVEYEDDITAISGDFGGMDIEANLLVIPPNGPLACEVIPALDFAVPGNRRVDLYSWTAVYGFAADPSLVSVGVPDNQPNFSFDFPALGTPPADHLSNDIGEGPMDGIDVASYIAVAYIDADSNGRWSGDQYAELPLASNDSMAPGTWPRVVMYVKATGWGAGYVAPYFGGLGWVLFEQDPDDPDEDIIPLDFSDGLVLDDNF